MTAKQSVDSFLKSKTIAVVGVSRNKKKFGYIAFKNLMDRGYNVKAINPYTDSIDLAECYKNLSSIKEKVDAALLVVPPVQSEKVVKEAHQLGIKNIWFQLGSSSADAVKFCYENDMSVVKEKCIMMFTEPIESIHKLHRWIWKLIGKLPK